MVQIIEQNHKEKVEMYMKLTKRELTEILIESNKKLESVIKNFNTPVVNRSYLYLVEYAWHSDIGYYHRNKTIIKFDSIHDITINTVMERAMHKGLTKCKILNITAL